MHVNCSGYPDLFQLNYCSFHFLFHYPCITPVLPWIIPIEHKELVSNAKPEAPFIAGSARSTDRHKAPHNDLWNEPFASAWGRTPKKLPEISNQPQTRVLTYMEVKQLQKRYHRVRLQSGATMFYNCPFRTHADYSKTRGHATKMMQSSSNLTSAGKISNANRTAKTTHKLSSLVELNFQPHCSRNLHVHEQGATIP